MLYTCPLIPEILFQGNKIGRITTVISLLHIWKLEINNFVYYFVLEKNKNILEDPICGISFEKWGENHFILEEIFIKPDYEKKGILSELFYFINKCLGFIISSSNYNIKEEHIPFFENMKNYHLFDATYKDDRYIFWTLGKKNNDSKNFSYEGILQPNRMTDCIY